MEDRIHLKQLTQEEQDTLGNLYMVANQINDDISWSKINEYFEMLGKKYDFDPQYHYISTDGTIIKAKKCYRCGGIANSIKGVKYDRFKENLGWSNRPICWSCYMKKYPHKAKMELMRK